jgi:hypothetical protein
MADGKVAARATGARATLARQLARAARAAAPREKSLIQ